LNINYDYDYSFKFFFFLEYHVERLIFKVGYDNTRQQE